MPTLVYGSLGGLKWGMLARGSWKVKQESKNTRTSAGIGSTALLREFNCWAMKEGRLCGKVVEPPTVRMKNMPQKICCSCEMRQLLT